MREDIFRKHAEIEALREEIRLWKTDTERAGQTVRFPVSVQPSLAGMETFSQMNRRQQDLRSDLSALLLVAVLRCPCCRSGVRVAAENLALLPPSEEVRSEDSSLLNTWPYSSLSFSFLNGVNLRLVCF